MGKMILPESTDEAYSYFHISIYDRGKMICYLASLCKHLKSISYNPQVLRWVSSKNSALIHSTIQSNMTLSPSSSAAYRRGFIIIWQQWSTSKWIFILDLFSLRFLCVTKHDFFQRRVSSGSFA